MKQLKKIEQDEDRDIDDEKQTLNEKPKVKVAKITEVVATTTNAFELESGEVVDINELLLRIYNNLLIIKRSVA